MGLPEYVHFGYGGSFQRTVTEDGSAADLSSATEIAIEFYDDPGDPIVSFNTTDDAANFDNTLASGIVRFVWDADTFTSVADDLVAAGKFRARHNARIVITTEAHTDGYVVPVPFVVEFRR